MVLSRFFRAVRRLDNGQLAKFAAIGGVSCVVAISYARYNAQQSLRNSDCYKQAFIHLHEHIGAVRLLGEPIYSGNVELGDTKRNFVTESIAKYEVPVRGTKSKGTFYVSASLNKKTKHWKIDRLEFQFENDLDRRLVIFKKEYTDDNNEVDDNFELEQNDPELLYL